MSPTQVQRRASRLTPTAGSTAGALLRLTGLPPVLARHTRALVLGSFPGVASLEAGQYYAHPRNQFWPLLGAVWSLDLATWPYARRLAELRRRGLGLWDVYAACRRPGSLDHAIRDAELNDFAGLRRRAPGLRWVLHNGGESARVRRALAALGYETLCLPSTSPAHASLRFEAKVEAWTQALRKAGLVGWDGSMDSPHLPHPPHPPAHPPPPAPPLVFPAGLSEPPGTVGKVPRSATETPSEAAADGSAGPARKSSRTRPARRAGS